jgi:hypothetical protein
VTPFTCHIDKSFDTYRVMCLIDNVKPLVKSGPPKKLIKRGIINILYEDVRASHTYTFTCRSPCLVWSRTVSGPCEYLVILRIFIVFDNFSQKYLFWVRDLVFKVVKITTGDSLDLGGNKVW